MKKNLIYSKLIIITLKRINPNTNKLTNTDTMSMSKNTRYEGTIAIMGPIKIRQEVVLVLIGKSGSNIQQIREVVGNDTYIRIFDSTKEKGYTQRIFKKCDKIYISSNNEKSLRKAAMMLKKTMNEFINVQENVPENPENEEKPINLECVVQVREEAIGTIIGKGGNNLRQLMSRIGNGCYIVFKRELNGFLISGNTKETLELGKKAILESDNSYFMKKDQHIQRHNKSSLQASFMSGQSYELNYREQKDLNKQRWEIREELSRLYNTDGYPVYPAYTVKDHKTGRKKLLSGVYSVPWSAVNDVMERNRMVEEDEELMAAAGMAKDIQDEKMSNLSEMDSWESLSNESKKGSLKGVWASKV